MINDFPSSPGGEAAEGAADGDARSPREVDDPRAQPLHPHGRCLRWTLYRSALRTR